MPSTSGSAAPAPSLGEVFARGSLPAARVDYVAEQSIYQAGDDDDFLYLIESGQVKLTILSASGQDCLLAIYTDGEIFGESCLTGTGKRTERATAMHPTIVRRVPRRQFIAEVERAAAFKPLVHLLAMRMEERQTAFFQRVTMVAEQRLAQVLIQLADKFGTPEGPYLRVEQHLSHEELSQFVGTTRPRVSEFMKHFRELGVIGPSDQRVIRVHRPKALKFLSTERRRRRSSQHKAR